MWNLFVCLIMNLLAYLAMDQLCELLSACGFGLHAYLVLWVTQREIAKPLESFSRPLFL